jgi:Ca2+-binding RTX toxin-like protein
MADNFANRSLLGGLAPSTSGSNIGATAEVGEPSQSGIINSEWWSWTAPNSGTFTIHTRNSNFDTFLSVFTGSAVNNLTLKGSNDDGGGNLTSLLSLDVTSGTAYQIAVDGFGDYTGNIQLNIVPVVIYGTPDDNTLTGTAYPETINGLEGNDTINGSSANDTLNGGDGSDYLDGGSGADQLIGGSNTWGSDIYVVDNAGDVVTGGGGEHDGVFSSITYTLPAGIEHLELTGTAAINGTGNDFYNTIKGNSNNNTLNGLAGNDYLDGDSGADQLIGGLGNDNYYVDNTGDVVTELAGQGTDDVLSTMSSYTLPAEVESLRLGGSLPISYGYGNSLPNTIVGNQFQNSLNGGGGSDTLNGGSGQDTLTGGTGTNTFVFLFGASLVSATDHITDFEIGSSKIDLLTDSGAQMSAPTSFSRAGDTMRPTLSDVVAQAFSDANGGLSGSQALGTNSAALIVATNASIAGNYLVINDATAGFQASKDLVIKLTTAGTLPPVGAIPVTNFFV